MNASKLPLHGLKVLDLSRFLAGPYCTMMLGDFGAEVLKVEPPGGDPTRLQGPPFVQGQGLTYLAANRNKKSLVLDFNRAEDLALVRELAVKADVLVENFRPGVLERFGLDPASLAVLNPRLVYASISGFGSTGPMAREGAFDLTIQAVGGYMSITGEPDAAPVKLGTSAFDMIAGMNLFSGILLALMQRQATGAGRRVETSLLESQIAMLSNAALEHLLVAAEPGRMGSEHPQLVPYKAFRTRDGWIVIGAGAQNLFEKLAHALGKPQWLRDDRFLRLSARVANRTVVNAEVERITSTHETAPLVHKLTAAGVPCAPVLSVGEALASEQVAARQMVVQLADRGEESLATLGSAIKIDAVMPESSWTSPPELDQGGRALADAWLCGEHSDGR